MQGSRKGKPKDTRYDIAIIGGGLVGLSSALLLATSFIKNDSKRRNIAVIESSEKPKNSSFHRTSKTIALSYGSRLIYQSLGIWDTLQPYAEPIHNIHVSDRGKMSIVRLAAKEFQIPALGYVLPEHQLLTILENALQAIPTITIYRPAQVETITIQNNQTQLQIQEDEKNHTLLTELTILADGGRSPLMKQLGFTPEIKEYGHTAIVSNINHSQPHMGTAFERFTDEGPMAMLPTPKNNGYQSAMIWTMPSPKAEERLQLTDETFIAELQERFGYRLGKITQVDKPKYFPLSLRVVAEPARQGFILLGNAAHSLHPVAGQGFNLSLRDAAVLASLLAKAPENQSYADLTLLQDFLDCQNHDQQATINFSSQLAYLFSVDHWLFQRLRTAGLFCLDNFFPAKEWFAQKAMGIGGYGQ